DYWTLVPPLIVAGIGISMSFPAAQNSVVGSVPEEAIGKAAGTNSTLRELGGVLGIAIGVAAFSGTGGYASPADFSDGFVAAISVSAGLSVLAALFGAALPARVGTGGEVGQSVPQAEPRTESSVARSSSA
ncbi:MAG TPA: hypothetical protein VIJ21_06785, partial [Solirubrobacterales bacterium]